VTFLAQVRRLFRDDETHFVQLAEHFFHRFFDNEFVAARGESYLTVVHILAVLALPGLFYTMYLYPLYFDIALYFPDSYPVVSMIDRSRYMFYSMAVVGFVAVLEWDALFPDRRDYTTLTVLPLRVPTLFAAKLAALAAFLGLFIADLNAVSTFLYPCVAMEVHGGTLLDLGWSILVHGGSVAAASVFIFLFFMALQGVLTSLLPYRAFRRVSLYVQVLAMVALLCLFFLLPMMTAFLPAWKRAGSVELYVLPPMWFVGLYETLLGSHDATFRLLATIAVYGLVLVVLISMLTYYFGYRRFMQRSLESVVEPEERPSRLRPALGRLLERLMLGNTAERAAFHFVSKTMACSPRHRLYLATYAGAGFALALVGIIEMLMGRESGIYQPGEALLAVPLVMSFFLLSGMRMIFTLPAELRANWVFRLTENQERKKCLTGVRKAMVAFGIVPLFSLLFPVYAVLWGWRLALFHLVFGLTLALILVEVLLLNFQKIPFTCSYLPGKANITLLGFLYWFAFTTYTYTMAALEYRVLHDPVLLALILGVAIPLLAGLMIYRNWRLRRGFAFIFDDQPEPIVRTLGLAE
jgi:hypothetical protein